MYIVWIILIEKKYDHIYNTTWVRWKNSVGILTDLIWPRNLFLQKTVILGRPWVSNFLNIIKITIKKAFKNLQ